jgi:LuxR family maltose regulon positive regulatory protein
VARKSLQEALALAGPGGWIRPFVEAGPSLADLIGRLPAEETDGPFVEQILSAATRAEPGRSVDPGPPGAKRPPVELLTNREAEILELLAQRLQYKEIATRLFISPQTVNSHLKNVYQKLHVSNRRQAVVRASELGLLSPD